MNQPERECPFCRAEGEALKIEEREQESHAYIIRCKSCGAAGPGHTSVLGAILLWDGAALAVSARSELKKNK